MVVVDDNKKTTSNATVETKKVDSNAKTGDTFGGMMAIMAVLAVISLMYIGFWFFVKRRR